MRDEEARTLSLVLFDTGSNGLHEPSDFSGELRCRAGTRYLATVQYVNYITSLGEGGAPRLAT